MIFLDLLSVAYFFCARHFQSARSRASRVNLTRLDCIPSRAGSPVNGGQMPAEGLPLTGGLVRDKSHLHAKQRPSFF